MHTILISGTFKSVDKGVEYDINIWASSKGESIMLVVSRKLTLSGYTDLWRQAKGLVSAYFDNAKFTDGARTQYLDHLIKIS